MERVTALHVQCLHFSTETVLVAARLRCTQRAAAETNDHRDATGLFCTTCSPRRPCKQRMAARRPAIYGGRYQLADSRLLEDHRALSGCASELRRLGHAVDGRGGGHRILRHRDVERRHGPIYIVLESAKAQKKAWLSGAVARAEPIGIQFMTTCDKRSLD